MLRRSPAVNIAAAGELLDRAVDQFVQIGGMDRWVARAEALRTPR